MADIKNRAKDIFNKAKNIYNGDNIKRSKAELSNTRDSYFYTKKLKEQKSKEFKDYLDFANGWGVIPLKKRRDYWTPKHERKLNEQVILLAPTGRASKRMSEACNLGASTIHRFLKWDKDTNTFAINELNKVHYNLIIIDY